MTPGRFGAAVVAVLALAAALLVAGGDPASVEAAVMCPPVTVDDLYPPKPPPRRPPSPATTVPESSSSTTAPDETSTTTTEPISTSSSEPESTSTTFGGEPTTTTTPGGSTSPLPIVPRPGGCTPFVYPLTWPVHGGSHVISSFGADRDFGARHHEGIDIQAPKLTPVLAVADGTVLRVTQEVGTENCCSLVIRHSDGWQSAYVHLNNDLFGTDDGMGIGVRPDLDVGVEVAAGEVVGWIGDSGNAEDSVDHVHFELRTRDGVAVDPAASLRRARLQAELPDGEPIWPYLDDEARGMQWVVARLLTEGLFLPCDESGLNFCPDQVADPEFVRTVVRHLAGVEPPLIEGHSQETPRVLEPVGDEQRVIGELMGCQTLEPCLAFGIPESELARIAAWALDRLQRGATTNPEVVIEMGQLETLPSTGEAEHQLRTSGLIGWCRPPLDHEQLLTREIAVTSLVRWIVGPMADCVEISQLRR